MINGKNILKIVYFRKYVQVCWHFGVSSWDIKIKNTALFMVNYGGIIFKNMNSNEHEHDFILRIENIAVVWWYFVRLSEPSADY